MNVFITQIVGRMSNPTVAESYAAVLLQHRLAPKMYNFPEGFFVNDELGIKFKSVDEVLKSIDRQRKILPRILELYRMFDLPPQEQQEREVKREFLSFQNEYALPTNILQGEPKQCTTKTLPKTLPQILPPIMGKS